MDFFIGEEIMAGIAGRSSLVMKKGLFEACETNDHYENTPIQIY